MEIKYSEILEEFPDKDKYPLYYEASRHEFTIGPGEMLFIPAGWFHFVFSEDADKETGLNFAVNFWYSPLNNWTIGNKSSLLPVVEKHNLQTIHPRDIFGNKTLRCTHSELNGMFPSDRVFHKFPNKLHFDFMTFDEFYQTKNPKYYIVQGTEFNLDHLAPKYPTKLHMTSSWVNFGNSRSLIHYDEQDNWLCQIQGKKRVLLFPQEERHMLYMFNPTPINILKEIINYYEAPMRCVIVIDDKILGDQTDYAQFYKEAIDYYDANVNKRFEFANIPSFEFPKEFSVYDSKGVPFPNVDVVYPITFLHIIEGRGTLQLLSRKTIYLDAGRIVMFPTHFTFGWSMKGNIKVKLPK